MAIEVKRNADGHVEIHVGDDTLRLGDRAARELNAQLTDLLQPETAERRSERAQRFLQRLRLANDTGIQGLLRNASHEDILVLLKSAEGDAPLKERLYANMTERSARLYAEDLQFRSQEEMPSLLAEDALKRLMQAAEQLADEGTLTFEAARPAQV